MVDAAVLGGGVSGGPAVVPGLDPVLAGAPRHAIVDEPKLTQKALRKTLYYNPETGVFTWLETAECRRMRGKEAGCLCPDGYISISFAGKARKAHRLAFLYMTGREPDAEVDHINRIKTDNRWTNLREAKRAENLQNLWVRTDNKSGYSGVCWHKSTGKWQATLGVNGRIRHLGIFNTIDDAVAARVAAKSELHMFNPDDAKRRA